MELYKIPNMASLQFSSEVEKKAILFEILNKHGIEIHGQVSGCYFYWTIKTEIQVDDLCNVLNDIGYNSVSTTAKYAI
jgi:hypothetical protein